jgi:competence protein ComEC
MRLPEIKSIEHGKGNYFYMKLYSFGDVIKYTINVYVREPSASFINGILLGEKHGLSKEWYETFTSIGLTHVIVLSGYNLAIIFAWTRIALRRTPFFVQHLCGACAVIALVLISGAEAPAVRAAILVLTASVAALLQRQEDAGYFLSLTVLVMLLWNPFYLLYDISFQLSVVATYGLTYLAPVLGQYIFSQPKFAHELVRDTISAQVMVLPLQLFYFGTLSWVSVFANIVILPFIPVLMVLGSFVLLFSFIPLLALCIGTLTTVLSDAVLSLVSFFASHTNVISISISLSTLFVLYICIYIFIVRSHKTV